jgi:hypothetical protein
MTKLSKTTRHHDSIMVVVDKLTKASHFILVKLTHKETIIVDIYLKETTSLHGIPKVIIPNRYPKFTQTFGKDYSGHGLKMNIDIIL